jgi:integrase
MHLTDISIKALQPPLSGQVTYTDDSLPGFGVRVSKGGVKSFVVVMGRSRRRLTIGRYPTISLQKARGRARELLAERTLGKREIPIARFGEALTLFLATHFPENYPKPRTKQETTRLLNRHFLPSLRHEKLEDIQVHHISKIIDSLQASPSVARHAFAAVRQFFNWAARRGYVERSPCERLKPPAPSKSRDRILSHAELKVVLMVARSEDTTFNNIVLLLLLTGQRRSEIGSLRFEWIDFENRTITLPSEVTKNKRQHTFPFGKMAEAILKKRKTNGFLFPARGKSTPFNGWATLTPRFRENCKLSPWTLHDLRRTFATNLAALGVAVHVTEKLLNHVSGTTGGIVAIYQRHSYMDEMRTAVDRWENLLEPLLTSK